MGCVLGVVGGCVFPGGIPARRARRRVPAEGDEETRALLEVFLLSKALSETATELNDRPDWAIIPLRGISTILGAKS